MSTRRTPEGDPDPAAFAGVSDEEISSLVNEVIRTGKQRALEPDDPGSKAGDGAPRLHARAIASQIPQAPESNPTNETNKEPATSSEDEDVWYFEIDKRQVGPLSLRKVRFLWDEGELGADTLCWRQGFGSWVALSKVTEMAGALVPRKPVNSNAMKLGELESEPSGSWKPRVAEELARHEPAKSLVESGSTPISRTLDEHRAGSFRALPAATPDEDRGSRPLTRADGFRIALTSGIASGLVVAAGAFALMRYALPPPTAPAPIVDPAPRVSEPPPAVAVPIVSAPTVVAPAVAPKSEPAIERPAIKAAPPPSEHPRPKPVAGSRKKPHDAFEDTFGVPGHDERPTP